jgi:hypothetical protein
MRVTLGMRNRTERAVIFAPSALLTVAIEGRPDTEPEIYVHAGGQGVWIARLLATFGAARAVCGPFGSESAACSSAQSSGRRSRSTHWRRRAATARKAAQLAGGMAPTRPHAGAESASANILIGPFGTMVDRARHLLGRAPAGVRLSGWLLSSVSDGVGRARVTDPSVSHLSAAYG